MSSADSGATASSRWRKAAAPIIAALSVQRAGSGMKTGTGEVSRTASRRRLLAATPPATSSAATPSRSATRAALRESTSATDSSKAWATSAGGRSGSAATRWATAVLRPEKEKSSLPGIQARGSRSVRSVAVAASRESGGPPG